eukprot:6320691-Alexandrium_andersonii.AAC.1
MSWGWWTWQPFWGAAAAIVAYWDQWQESDPTSSLEVAGGQGRGQGQGEAQRAPHATSTAGPRETDA